MGQKFLGQIDHYLQLNILNRLVDETEPMAFTKLKDPGIDNSLFNYHLSKLVDNDYVAKTTDGYALAAKGARVMNWYGGQLTTPIQPRLLLNFYCTNDEQILLAQRKGPSADLLNSYMLPGGIPSYGLTDEVSVAQLSTKLFAKPMEVSFVGQLQPIINYPDGFISHHVLNIYRLAQAPNQLVDDNHFELKWVARSAILSGEDDFKDSPFLADIISAIEPNNTFGIISRSYTL